MKRSILNPKPSDYAGQLLLGGGCMAVGLLLLVFGLDESGGWVSAVMAMIGVALLIGGGAVIHTAWRSKCRAEQMKDD